MHCLKVFLPHALTVAPRPSAVVIRVGDSCQLCACTALFRG